MANDIDYAKVYTRLLDKVYTEASLSTCLNSPRGLVRETRGGHEIMVPKIRGQDLLHAVPVLHAVGVPYPCIHPEPGERVGS